MEWPTLHETLLWIQHSISFIGVLIILSGILRALYQYLCYCFTKPSKKHESGINMIRLDLGRILILGLEFIVAADLIATTTTPDYYSLGIVASIVLIRTVLNYSLNRELVSLSKN